VVVVDSDDVAMVGFAVANPELAGKYHRARWMDPTTGGFAGLDPFGGNVFEPATLHKYVYAQANPANMSDPTGMFSVAAQVTVALVLVIPAMASLGLGGINFLTRVAVPLNVRTRVVIIDDTGWDDATVFAALDTARWTWMAAARIAMAPDRIVRLPKPSPSVNLLQYVKTNSPGAKHWTVFKGAELAASGHARASDRVAWIAGGLVVGNTAAHEWGHTFNLGDTFALYGNVMHALGGSLLTPGQVELARATATIHYR
jgi:RHS repeat-associated protein